ncbi:MAG: NupC/NupG family nucleoside CNT transporter [Bacilli bacterium]
MQLIIGLFGLAAIAGLSYLLSNNKKEINFKSLFVIFLFQALFAILLLNTKIGYKLLEIGTNAVSWTIGHANAGIQFVFGELATENGFVFILSGLFPVIFVSALMGLLFHFNVIQFFVGHIAGAVARTFKIHPLVCTNSVVNIFLGQTDALTVTRSYLPRAHDNVVFATLVGGMTSISVAVVALYASFGIKMEYLLLSMFLTVFSTLILTQIVRPSAYEEEAELKVEADKGQNAIDTMMSYATVGAKMVAGIMTALVVFVSITSLLNGVLGFVDAGLTFEKILGYFFMPFAFLMGIPFAEVSMVSELLAAKIFINETVAFSGLAELSTLISERSFAMMTFALCGFANISSIGIMIGSYSAVAPNRAGYVAKVGVLAMIVATLANLFTATLVGLFL